MTTPGPRMQNKSGGVCNDLLLWHKCHGKKSAKKYAYFSYLNFSILLFLESVTFGSIEPIFLKVVQDGLKLKKILYFCNIHKSIELKFSRNASVFISIQSTDPIFFAKYFLSKNYTSSVAHQFYVNHYKNYKNQNDLQTPSIWSYVIW